MGIDFTIVGFGALVGLSLGLTGGGGSILAIPLLVYGARVPMQQALVVSLIMVTCIAAFGAIRQTIERQIDWNAAIMFSLTGMIVSPFIVSIAQDVDDTLRTSLFALLMLFVAGNMVKPLPLMGRISPAQTPLSRFVRIGLGGGLAGALAGFFGVGGGFIIVPLLTLLFVMPYMQAVGTSLASIALISSSAIIGHFVKGVTLDVGMLATFIGGGVLGLLIGLLTMNKISELNAKRVFAFITAAMAIFMLINEIFLNHGGDL